LRTGREKGPRPWRTDPTLYLKKEELASKRRKEKGPFPVSAINKKTVSAERIFTLLIYQPRKQWKRGKRGKVFLNSNGGKGGATSGVSGGPGKGKRRANEKGEKGANLPGVGQKEKKTRGFGSTNRANSPRQRESGKKNRKRKLPQNIPR